MTTHDSERAADRSGDPPDAETSAEEQNGGQVALPNLHEHHRRVLVEESAIDPTVIAERGYYTATTKADLARKGFSRHQQSVPAIAIPIHTVAGEVAWIQIRPDEPRLKRGKKVKYESPSNVSMVLDVHPRSRLLLADPGIPLLVTEGSKKVDAAVSRGICAVGVIGVWSWRGSNEHGGKTVLPDWEAIALNGRKVYLCFDCDVMEKAPVYRALVRLRKMLTSRGADVMVVYLPSGPGGTKVGLDDWFAADRSRTRDDLLALAEKELRKPPREMLEHRQVVEALEDAPASDELTVPPGYELSRGGVVRVEECAGRDGEVGEKRTDIAPRPVFLAGILDDVSGPGRKKRFVIVYRYRDEWMRAVVDRGVALDARKLVHLADGGMPITSGRTGGVVEYLADFESANLDRLPYARVSSQLGWQPGGGYLIGKLPLR